MKTRFTSAAVFLSAAIFVVCCPLSSRAQGLFAKAADQSQQGLAAFVTIWDSFYGNIGDFLVAEALKDGGKLEFEPEKGLAHFPVRVSLNKENYARWLAESKALLEAVGVQEGLSPSIHMLDSSYIFPEGVAAEIKKAWDSGDLEIPRFGIIVELVDKDGKMIAYAALPPDVFRNESGNSNQFPLKSLGRKTELNGDPSWGFASLSFAGITKDALLAVDDIRCRVLVDPEYTKECHRLALEKIEADTKVFSEHGIESKTIMLPGGVPLAVNKTPAGFWFSRYEITKDQWQALMGDNPGADHRNKKAEREEIWNVLVGRLSGNFVEKAYGRRNCPDFPVDYVPYTSVLRFIAKLNELPEVKETGIVFDLPNAWFFHPDYRRQPDSSWNTGKSPDWEYACLGASARTVRAMQYQGVLFGLDIDGNKMDFEVTGWSRGQQDRNRETGHAKYWDIGNFLHPVGLKRPNAFGLYDMLGNASELSHGLEGNAGGDNLAKGEMTYSNEPDPDYTMSSRSYRSIDKEGKEGRGFRLQGTGTRGPGTATANGLE